MASDESDDRKRPEIFVDEDWKNQVKAEDSALDEKRRAEEAAKETESKEETEGEKSADVGPGIDPSQIPPPDFATLVGILSTQAMVTLGVLPDPATGKAESVPVLAKHFIGLLGVLEEKTKGNLDPDEMSLLESSLHQLRLAYIEVTK